MAVERPAELPRWATDPSAVITAPSEAAKDIGHVPRQILTAGLANWLQGLVYQWLAYFDEGAAALQTTGASVEIVAADPPVAGQVLMATAADNAIWKVPGLHYDAAIRFNVDAGGVATIEPGTWGFVQTVPVGSSGVTIFVVSSLTAPPVDSRFGLYISPSVSVPVTVSLIGASQIMGLDGVLATSIVLPAGAMYEWVFYHENSVAIWGLVSDTAHIADALSTTGAAVTISAGAPPTTGHVLTATSATTAAFAAPVVLDVFADYSSDFTASYGLVHLIDTSSNDVTVSLPSAAAEPGRRLVLKRVSAVGSVNVKADGADMIDDVTSYPMPDPWQKLTLVSNGTNWFVLS